MRILLLPIALFYYIVLVIRHKLYDWHLLKSKRFEQPVINVGNLALGGTGKTPHVEYLIDLLSEQYHLCVVSRGYGRKTKGFQLANSSCGPETIGDEPVQYVNKFSEIMVAVDENRNEAIELMNTIDRPPELYLLDDAFQHRSTQAGLSILLTTYNKLYTEDHLVPAGTLRDLKSAAKRADIIIVSKSPGDIDKFKKADILEKLNPLPHQTVYFSSLEYQELKEANHMAYQTNADDADAVLLFCGIARPKDLEEELKRHYPHVELLAFPDHHFYSMTDVGNILQRFKKMAGTKKIIVTTEKDAARFKNSPYICQFDSVPVFVAPIKAKIDEEEKFNEEILRYVQKNAHHG